MYHYVIAGRNVALGVCPDMATARASVLLTAPGASQTCTSDCYDEWVTPDGDNLTIVAVRPSALPCVLYS